MDSISTSYDLGGRGSQAQRVILSEAQRVMPTEGGAGSARPGCDPLPRKLRMLCSLPAGWAALWPAGIVGG